MGSFLLLVLISVISMIIGLLAGFIVANKRFRNTLTVAFKSIVRVFSKTLKRVLNPKFDLVRIERDENFSSLPRDIKLEQADQLTIDIVYEFKHRLQQYFGHKLKAVYLYGSRARGDYGPDSDIDVAVFVSGISTDYLSKHNKEVARLTTEFLFDYGMYIQPRIFESGSIENPENYPQSYLIRAILACGILL